MRCCAALPGDDAVDRYLAPDIEAACAWCTTAAVAAILRALPDLPAAVGACLSQAAAGTDTMHDLGTARASPVLITFRPGEEPP
jgi:hypothetical protein